MLVLMCHAGPNRYAVDSTSVVEVVPFVHFHTVAESPHWLTGVFAYRGVATPLVDVTQLLTGHPCPRRWNSRIILARAEAIGMPTHVGLLAERVTTAEIDRHATADSAGPRSALEALGPILLDDQGLFQLVDVSRLLTPERRAAIPAALSEGT